MKWDGKTKFTRRYRQQLEEAAKTRSDDRPPIKPGWYFSSVYGIDLPLFDPKLKKKLIEQTKHKSKVGMLKE
jgi:hypothetical protein